MILLLAACGWKTVDVPEEPADTACSPTTWHADTDGDGFGAADAAVEACQAPDAHVVDATDCDDTTASVHPGASDEWYDGVDANCDGASDFDADLDGAEHPADCDDADPAVHPGADEHCDGVDEDCDGAIDDAPVDGAEWLMDADSDGFGDDASSFLACGTPEGGVTVGGDCDDTEKYVHPDMDELCETPEDDDCSGSANDDGADGCAAYYPDADVDSWGGTGGQCLCVPEAAFTATRSGDCDDADATVNPEAGGCLPSPLSLAEADATLHGAGWDMAGISLDLAGDFDGDGQGDLLLGAYGMTDGGSLSGGAFVVRGPFAGAGELAIRDEAWAVLIGEREEEAGLDVAGVGDVDGDGLDDVAVGARYAYGGAGAVYLVHGGASGEVPLTSADARVVAEAADAYANYVDGPGDLDGDGLDDLLIGAPRSTRLAGSAYVVSGGFSGELSLASADAELRGEASGDMAGAQLDGAGDTDGDGHLDVLVGAPYNTRAGQEAGAVYVVRGPFSGDRSLSAADVILVGEAAGSMLACPAGVGDTDGDGLADFVASSAAFDPAVAWLLAGGRSGILSVEDADVRMESPYPGAGTLRTAGPGDVNGDGFADVFLGTIGGAGGSSGTPSFDAPGRSYLVLGPVPREAPLEGAWASFAGVNATDYATNVAGGDVDGDGRADLLIGGSGMSYGVSAGAAYYIDGSRL